MLTSRVGYGSCKATILPNSTHYEEALAAYEQALYLTPDDVRVSSNKGHVLAELNLAARRGAFFQHELEPHSSRSPLAFW